MYQLSIISMRNDEHCCSSFLIDMIDVGDEIRHPRKSPHASIHTKVSGSFEDWTVVTPSQQK